MTARRWFAIGDPQTTFDTFLDVLRSSRSLPSWSNRCPLHVAGRDGREGGGLLYHRPSAKRGDDDVMAPRRFDPRALPRGLVQACGHTGHHKAKKELAPWVGPTAATRDHGGLCTLSVGDDGPAYEMGILPPSPTDATLYMIDIELNARIVPDHPLLDLDRVA